MLKYSIIRDDVLKDFQNRVNMALEEGWELYGNLQLDSCFNQVVIKHTGDTNETNS